MAQQTRKRKRERREREGQELMRLKIKSLFLAEVTLLSLFLPRQQPGQRVSQGHTSQLANRLPHCPNYPSTPYLSLHHLHLPFRVLGVKSVIGSRASPAARQQGGKQATRHGYFGSQRRRHLHPALLLLSLPLSASLAHQL